MSKNCHTQHDLHSGTWNSCTLHHWNIAKPTEVLNKTNTLAGTPEYMAPDTWQKHVVFHWYHPSPRFLYGAKLFKITWNTYVSSLALQLPFVNSKPERRAADWLSTIGFERMWHRPKSADLCGVRGQVLYGLVATDTGHMECKALKQLEFWETTAKLAGLPTPNTAPILQVRPLIPSGPKPKSCYAFRKNPSGAKTNERWKQVFVGMCSIWACCVYNLDFKSTPEPNARRGTGTVSKGHSHSLGFYLNVPVYLCWMKLATFQVSWIETWVLSLKFVWGQWVT